MDVNLVTASLNQIGQNSLSIRSISPIKSLHSVSQITRFTLIPFTQPTRLTKSPDAMTPPFKSPRPRTSTLPRPPPASTGRTSSSYIIGFCHTPIFFFFKQNIAETYCMPKGHMIGAQKVPGSMTSISVFHPFHFDSLESSFLGWHKDSPLVFSHTSSSSLSGSRIPDRVSRSGYISQITSSRSADLSLGQLSHLLARQSFPDPLVIP